MPVLTTLVAALVLASPPDALEPWASKSDPGDVTKRHMQDVTAAMQEYRITQGGTMDGVNCQTPISGGFGISEPVWESNRSVRLENIGETDVINPWLSNGRNNFRSVPEIVDRAIRPGMSEQEQAIALWRLHATHRFHASSGDNEVNDPVKVFNVFGYTTCGNDSICMAGLWHAAGFPVRPARCPGHCISQVFYNGRWNLLDGDMGPYYLLRDNVTLASEKDLVRDHDLVKRTHTHGLVDPDSRAADEASAALFISEAEWEGGRDSIRTTTMNMVLRPNEALVWRWGHLTPVKYHGRIDIKVFGPRNDAGKTWGGYAADWVCNGLWEYRPDFTRDVWRRGAAQMEGIHVENGEVVPAEGKTGTITWKLRSPYPFVGGRLEVEGTGAKFSLSFDGSQWTTVDGFLEAFFHFPHKGDARYEYWLKCELPPGARLKRLAISNDLQMAPLSLPGTMVGENRFTYTDDSQGERKVRVTHEWVERSLSHPPAAPSAPVYPPADGQSDGSQFVFQWRPAIDPDGDAVTDYHFQLSNRADMAWPLSANFEKLVSNTSERGQERYRVPYAGLLNPRETYYWRVRGRDSHGVWGAWSEIWRFTPGAPAQPVDVRLEPSPGDDTHLVLRWNANPRGSTPAKYRVYASDEKGFSISDETRSVNVGRSPDVPAQSPPSFIAETSRTELIVAGPAVDSQPQATGSGSSNTASLANKAYYRVVAVDDAGHRSGPSDYASAPRPFLVSRPVDTATIGAKYEYALATIRSLGDLRSQLVDGKSVTKFWDIEQPRFTLVEGPKWLRLDERTGVLTGVPDAAGPADVAVNVVLERPLRKLDDSRLSWGHEIIKELGTDRSSTATQRFRVVVGR